MGELVVEILSEVLPDSDWLKVAALAVGVVIVKCQLEWIGWGVRYVFRWVRCYVLKTHHYVLSTNKSEMHDQLMTGTRQCSVCLNTEHIVT